MKSVNDKRLDKIELELTPKQWAIRIADALSECESMEEFAVKEQRAKPPSAALTNKAEDSLDKQAAAKYSPDKSDETSRAYKKLLYALAKEYETLFFLLLNVNKELSARAEKAGFQAAYTLQILQTIILQDSFSRTASKAAEWIELVKTEDADDEDNRQIMLQELEAYRFDSPIAETVASPKSLELGSVRIDFPSAIEDWLTDAKALIYDLYSHRLAVQIVQEKYFDGHSILTKKTAADLERIIGAVEAAVERHNEYLALREKLFGAEWEEAEREGFTSVGLSGERQGRLEVSLQSLRPKKQHVEQRLIKEWLTLSKAEVDFKLSALKRGAER